MPSAKDISDLLACLYAAPLAEGNWHGFLMRLCSIVRTDKGFLISSDANGSVALGSGGSSVDPEGVRLYNEHFGLNDPFRMPFMRRPRSGVIQGGELLTTSELKSTEFYQDFLVPFNQQYLTLLPCSVSAQQLDIVTFWGGQRTGEMGREALELLELLLPHLQTALKVRTTLATANARALRAEAALDRIQSAAFLFGRSGNVIHMNQSAERLVQCHDGLSLSRNRLAIADHACQRRVNSLITSAAAAAGASMAAPGGAAMISRPSGKSSYQIQIMPLRVSTDANEESGHVLAFIHEPEATPLLPPEILRSLYGLSNAETEVVNGLFAGRLLEEIAEVRSVTIGTIRIQMKSILHKTGARRQSDLIRLLMNLI